MDEIETAVNILRGLEESNKCKEVLLDVVNKKRVWDKFIKIVRKIFRIKS